jgi:hypothetical protein
VKSVFHRHFLHQLSRANRAKRPNCLPNARPSIREPIARRPRIGRVQHILTDAANPGPVRNDWHDGRPAADLGLAGDPAGGLGAYDGAGAIDVAPLTSVCARSKPPCGRCCRSRSASGRSCQGDDATGRTLKFVSFSRERSGELTERDVVQPPPSGWKKPNCSLAAAMTRNPRFGQIARFVRLDCEAERGRIDDDETVAAISNVDSERDQARNLERRLRPVVCASLSVQAR